MFRKLLKTLRNQKGAMDRILVTLILVILGIGALVGVTSWYNSQKETMRTTADSTIANVLNETNSLN